MTAALLAIAAFVLGVRVGLALGYRAERGRRIVAERAWLEQLARVMGAKPPELESIDAARARILGEARARHASATPD
jgi:hypothetical protein